MPDSQMTIEGLAEQVRVALQSADLDAYRELLDPDVSWGPPDDDVSGCHNRAEVLAWYRQGRERGVRADVIETTTDRDKILVGLRVRGGGDPSEEDVDSTRWQLLTVVDGRVKDIRGFDNRDEAIARMR
jgi:hypothetical protein